MAISRRSSAASMQTSMFSSEAPRASPSASLASEADWTTTVATWPSHFAALLAGSAPAGSYGRTSPVSSRWTAGELSPPSSEGWQSAGMVSPTECWTLSLCEWTATHAPCPSDGAVCSLSDILATGDVPPRYYLSAKACLGILRRAEKRGKALPPLLRRALEAVAASGLTSTATGD